jgi:hypothetical protein
LAADTQQQQQQQQQMVLAAAVLLHAGAGASESTLSVSGSASGGAGRGGMGREESTLRVMTRGNEGQQDWQGSTWHGLNSRQRKRQEARQQQQQRVLLGQLLQLQLQKASEQLVQAVRGSNPADTTSQQSFTGPAEGIPATSPAPVSASAYATQVLLDPTGQLLAPQTVQQQQQQGEGQQGQGSEGRSSGLRSSSSGSGSPPHRLVTQGLQVCWGGEFQRFLICMARLSAATEGTK